MPSVGGGSRDPPPTRSPVGRCRFDRRGRIADRARDVRKAFRQRCWRTTANDGFQNPGAGSRLWLHAPLVGCVGSGGGFRSGGPPEKSKNSIMLSAFASRRVNVATLNLSSIRRRIEV